MSGAAALPMTRAAGLERLEAVLPTLGEAYAARRGHVAGPGEAGTTSALSPFLRRRLLTEEEEVVRAAIAMHGAGARRFVEEVCWRSYFKGHLEWHPWVWNRFEREAAAGRARLNGEPGLRRAHAAAVEGRTGIDGFDDWARGVREEGWLHNHARMWFASIWVFTLGLPWALGAAFFLEHLVDGDPASNTLSWRWVAGLHTRGKAYAATGENVRLHSGGRWAPAGLAERVAAIEEAEPGAGERTGMAGTRLPAAGVAPEGAVALLVHGDDLHPESWDLGGARVARVAGLGCSMPGVSALVRRADDEAMADALRRAAERFGCAAGMVEPGAEPGWAGGLPVVTAWAPVGPAAEALRGVLPDGGVRLRRRWDELVWAEASRGYGRVRKRILVILKDVGIGGDGAR